MPLVLKGSSWEPPGLLEVDTIMDLILNTHNGVGIEHQGSHQVPWNRHAKKLRSFFPPAEAHRARLQTCWVKGSGFLLQRQWQYHSHLQCINIFHMSFLKHYPLLHLILIPRLHGNCKTVTHVVKHILKKIWSVWFQWYERLLLAPVESTNFKKNICMELLFLSLETICVLAESGCKPL